MESHFLIKVLEYAYKKHDGFSYLDLTSAIQFEEWEKEILKSYFSIARDNSYRRGLPNYSYNPETIFQLIKGNHNESYNSPNMGYIPTSEAFFNFIDYQELKFARENAYEAKALAIAAITASIIIPFIMALFMTQNVRIIP